MTEAFAISNRYAPEHLILQIENAESYLPQVINAGSVFVGAWTPESVGIMPVELITFYLLMVMRKCIVVWM